MANGARTQKQEISAIVELLPDSFFFLSQKPKHIIINAIKKKEQPFQTTLKLKGWTTVQNLPILSMNWLK
jgi:hypothetical protein